MSPAARPAVTCAGTGPAARLALLAGLCALWLLGRRYAGITHDAVLYTAQGLRRLQPEVFAQDLFFAWGAQDAYSLFPRLYAPLIDALGVSGAALGLTLAGHAAFLAAAWWLCLRLLPRGLHWWSLALLAAFSGYYGGGGVFRVAESFATARTVAEPLVLAALALALGGRPRIALAPLGLAALLHPLVALPGLAVTFLWHALAHPRRLWLLPVLAAALAAVFAGLLLAGSWPWPQALLRFDPAWRAAVLERTPYVFVSAWPLPDWARLAWGLCVTALAARHAGPVVRRLALATALACLAGIAASAILVDLFGSVLAASLQLWRSHWLQQVLAIMLLPLAVAGLWRTGPGGRALAGVLAASGCFGRHELAAAALLAFVVLVLSTIPRAYLDRLGARGQRLVLAGALAIAATGLMFAAQAHLPSAYFASGALAWRSYLPAALAAGLLPLAALLWLGARLRFAPLALALPAMALAAALWLWDARSPWVAFLEQAGAAHAPYRAAVPAGRQVYWDAVPAPAWLVLRTPSWFGRDQGAGIVFNQATAREYTARERDTGALRAAEQACAGARDAACRIEATRARDLCLRPGGPDYLVLGAPVAGQSPLEWRLPAGATASGRLFLHDCRELRGAPVATPGPAG